MLEEVNSSHCTQSQDSFMPSGGRRSIVMYGMFLGVFLCVESKSVKTFCGTLLQIPILSKKLENGFSDFAFQSSYFFVRALCVVLKSMIGCRIVWGTF